MDISNAEEILLGVSPGPWRHAQEAVDPEWSVVTTFGGAVIANINDRADCHPNARFIAWAREGVPALLAENERLREALRFGCSASINSLHDESGNRPSWSEGSGIWVMLAALGCHGQYTLNETVRAALKGDTHE